MELSVAESAARLGVSEEAVRARLRAGDLPGRQILAGRRSVWRVDAEAVSAWQERRRRARIVLPGPGAGMVVPERGPAGASVADRRGGGGGEVAALEAEVARLRRQVAVLTRAVAALTDA